MTIFDWSIVGCLILSLCVILVYCQRYVKNTADFLAANRCAGRYILTISAGIGGLGAITIIATFEMYYNAGFTPLWWELVRSPLALFIAIAGWVFYRLRETRALTLAQFFEVRYSRNFRVFTGILAWSSGVVNYGIFPAVGTRFFIYFCGIPVNFEFLGISWDTYALLLALFIGIGVLFACYGGQVAIMVTDFFQGMFCNVAFLVLLFFFFFKFDWQDIFTPLLENAQAGASMVNPFETAQNRNFSIWFFLIGLLLSIYCQGAWQGAQGYQVAAKNPHEAKMSRFLGEWRMITQTLLFMFIPICAFAVMHNQSFITIATQVRESLAGIDNAQIQKQLTVSMVMAKLLPPGLLGMFAAVMFAAMLSTDNTYMHSWGSVFIQDVIIPFRKKAFSPRFHIILLRFSILFVGIFAWTFSYFFRQTEYILMFFAITGAIWLGGAGSVVIGGLYWRKGTTTAAWWSMIIGSSIATFFMVAQQLGYETASEWGMGFLYRKDASFIVHGQWVYFIAMIISCTVYVVISLLERAITGRPDFNLEKMLHRGKYDIKKEHEEAEKTLSRWLKRIGLTKEFSKGDRVIFFMNISWCIFWFSVFIIGTVSYVFFWKIPDRIWIKFWQFKIYIAFGLGIITTVWFLIGGCKDVRGLFRALREKESNDRDDGMVVNGHNAGENFSAEK